MRPPIFWRVVASLRRWCAVLVASWRADAVSGAWLRHQDRLEERVEYHGVGWRWPVRKRIDEAGRFNRERLRQSA